MLNLASTSVFILIAILFLVGFDGFFAIASLNCIAKMKVCCHYLSKIGDSDETKQPKYVEKCIEKHLEIIEIIDLANSAYELVFFGEILSGFGIFLVITSQFSSDFSPLMISDLMILLCQIFAYCYLGDVLADWVRKLV
jgi:hypothetical protein